eukprot:scaffold88728_cov20-Prasinocladus_malaysianus.AAC.3
MADDRPMSAPFDTELIRYSTDENRYLYETSSVDATYCCQLSSTRPNGPPCVHLERRRHRPMLLIDAKAPITATILTGCLASLPAYYILSASFYRRADTRDRRAGSMCELVLLAAGRHMLTGRW